MKTHEDCRSCLLRQMKRAAKAAGADKGIIEEVAAMVHRELDEIWDTRLSPPEISAPLYHKTGRLCGKEDPYLVEKVRFTREALKHLPEIESRMSKTKDPFDLAVRISIAGNAIDFGTGDEKEDLATSDILDGLLDKPMHINDTGYLRQIASRARKIIVIGDNAGETVFDRPLLSLLRQTADLYYATRDVPIINDATIKDAVLAGIGLTAEIVSSGSQLPGTVLRKCSSDFRDLYDSADLIIAKGQGNFETLTELPRDGRLFMLFIIKCSVAARQIGGKVGDMVVMQW